MEIHIIRPGETIWSIANLYGVSPERIISDNGLSGQEFLVSGQALIILFSDIIYTVKPNDTIYSIAKSYNISTIELIQKNITLALNPLLYPGQQLTIKFSGESNRLIEIYGYIYPYISNNILFGEAPYLTLCAIFSYGFNADGSLIEINDYKYINILNQFYVKPVMLLSSIDEKGSFDSEKASLLFNDKDLQKKVIENMGRIVYEKNYKGVDIDFEYVEPKDREAFAEFVQNITTFMNERGISVNVDLAPKTSESQRGVLYEGHNYSDLANAANTVLLMTYEWGYTYGPPMAVSPINQVRQVVEFAVSQINKNKIYMGIPNYGYDWKLPYEKGITKATSIGNEQAIRIASDYGATIKFDSTAQSPYFEYRDENGSEHIVWFEDVRSIKKKYELIEDFELRGSGYWNLMRPFAQNWSFIAYRYSVNKKSAE